MTSTPLRSRSDPPRTRFPWNSDARCALHRNVKGDVVATTPCDFAINWIRLLSTTGLDVGNYVIAELTHPERGVRCTLPMRVTRADRQQDGSFDIEGAFTRDLTAEEMFGLW